ncbi:MAG TPA: YicC/YloC family endoribonuclease [Candidatus Kapabacteria bacterium]|nr:YicC/YloC family endoribonuclease [Candidatus Kapabacteria bacterium]
MLISMTGFGRGEAVSTKEGSGVTATAEIRSVNSRFLETSMRLPRTLSEREFEVRELLRKGLGRGKINLNVIISGGDEGANIPLSVNETAAKGYFDLLDKLRTIASITAEITVRDITAFSDVFISDGASGERTAEEWELVQQAIIKAIESLTVMRKQEGAELEKDFRNRIAILDTIVTEVESKSKDASKAEFERMKERVKELVSDPAVINNERLELEIALLAERLDITEEIVRFRSHIKFFLEALESNEPAGRKLNFLLQEMNREINTMGSKSIDAPLAHKVVGAKEELEKIREQVQNIE